jgi:hypothetical protein
VEFERQGDDLNEAALVFGGIERRNTWIGKHEDPGFVLGNKGMLCYHTKKTSSDKSDQRRFYERNNSWIEA